MTSRADVDPIVGDAAEAIRRRAGALCPRDAARVVDALDVLLAEVDRFHADYEQACRTIAAMHEAAVGEIRGPRRGVVEDVADLRDERDRLASHGRDLEAAIGRHPSSGRPAEEPLDALPILAELLARIDRERRRARNLADAGDDLADYLTDQRITVHRIDTRLDAWRAAREGTPNT
jgi:hypothetical protein